MAVQCKACGSFTQEERNVCPVCGGHLAKEPLPVTEYASRGGIQGYWNHFRELSADWFGLSPNEALVIKGMLVVMALMAAITLYAVR